MSFYTSPPDFSPAPNEFSTVNLVEVENNNGNIIYNSDYSVNFCNEIRKSDAKLIKGSQMLIVAKSGSEIEMTTTLTCKKNGKKFIKEFFRSCNFNFKPTE